jgi:pectate lyase
MSPRLTLNTALTGIGFYIKDSENVIMRNLKISKVKAANGDAIGIQASSNVWVDHCDLSSDMDNGKDYYDGLCDVTHASEYVTISNTYIHDHVSLYRVQCQQASRQRAYHIDHPATIVQGIPRRSLRLQRR